MTTFKYDLFAIGTPVVDRFAQVGDSFLSKFRLVRGSTNFIKEEELAAIEAALAGKITTQYPGDNARNVCEGFLTLAKEGKKSSLGGASSPSAPARVGYAGKIAHDGLGRIFEQNLLRVGADGFLEYDEKSKTGRISCLISPDKERTFAAYLGASSNALDIDRLPGAKMVFCTSITLLTGGAIAKCAREYIERAKKEGSLMALSLESPAMLAANRESALRLCRLADVLFLNEDEAAAIGVLHGGEKEAGRPAPFAGAEKEAGNPASVGGKNAEAPKGPQWEVGKLAKLVFLKKGKEGSIVFKDGKMLLSMPAQQVEKVADTTGAGDAYAAGALWALASGYDEKGAALEGSKLSARIIQQVGNKL